MIIEIALLILMILTQKRRGLILTTQKMTIPTPLFYYLIIL